MTETYEQSLSLFPTAGAAPAASDVGFRFGAKGTHTSRTMMFEELRQVFEVTLPDARRSDYAAAIIDDNGLPLVAIPGIKLEPGRRWPAAGLAEAERRAARMLAARSFRVPAGGSPARSGA